MIKWTDLFKSDEKLCRELIGKTYKIEYEKNPFKDNDHLLISIIDVKNGYCKYKLYNSKYKNYIVDSSTCKFRAKEFKYWGYKIVSNDIWDIEKEAKNLE